MTQEEKEKLLKSLLAGGQVNIGQLSVGDHNTLNYFEDEKEKEDSLKSISMKELGEAICAVQGMFWGNSSYAVIFSTLRDCYNHEDNYTLFEDEIGELSAKYQLDYPCPPNTIASTFHNNEYLKLNVDKWEKNKVKQRSIMLYKAFVNAVNDIRKRKKF